MTISKILLLLLYQIIFVTGAPPVFPNAIETVTLNENIIAPASLGTFSATDADLDVLTYTIENDPSAYFSIDATTGEVSAAKDMDIETPPPYTQITVRASDAGQSDTYLFKLVIDPVNEFTPVFGADGTFSPAYVPATGYTISETVAVNHAIATIVATDADDGADGVIDFTIASVTPTSGTSKFVIDGQSGTIYTSETFQRDGTGGVTDYTLSVKITDRGVAATGGSKNSLKDIKVVLTDINDETPLFSSGIYTCTFLETTASATTLSVSPALAITDDDSIGTYTYTFISGNTNSHFSIDNTTPKSPKLVLANAVNLDKPDNHLKNYVLKVKVDDGASHTATTIILVDVDPVNDYDPQFTPATNPVTASVSEAEAVGYLIHTVTGTDQDYGEDGQIRYVVQTNPNNWFNVDEQNGEVRLSSIVDYDVLTVPQRTVNLIIKIEDKSLTTIRSTLLTITVTITDVSDENPSCIPGSFVKTLNENVVVGTAVATLACTDSDVGETIVYSIDPNTDTGGTFQISAAGAITVQTPPDYETTQSYNLDALAVSGPTGSEKTVIVPVVVNISPLNEGTPVITSSTVTKNENIAVGSQLYHFIATDTDNSPATNPHNVKSYKIFSVTNGETEKFSIDSVTGWVMLAAVVDYETVQTYEIVVVARDGGGLEGTATLTLSLVDVNDNAPSCSSYILAGTINENANVNDIVPSTTPTCSDADATSPNNLIEYKFATPSGNTNTAFDVDPTTGAIKVKTVSSINYEGGASYRDFTLKVLAVDKSGAACAGTCLTSTITVRVTVNPINEASPVITGANTYTATIAENLPVANDVGTVIIASDTDQGLLHGTLRYSITGGNTDNCFGIKQTGQIYLEAALDRDGKSLPGNLVYTLTVTVADNIPSSEKIATTTYVITVTDINDNSPVFTQNLWSATISETAAVSSLVKKVTATDEDVGTNGAVTYTITGGNAAGKFKVSGDEIQINALLDYDAMPIGTGKSYLLNLKATDGGGLTSTSSLQITVSPVNEATPTYTHPNQVINLPEIDPPKVLYTVSATDTDIEYHGDIRYTLTSPASSTIFHVNPITGDVSTLQKIDYEAGTTTFVLTITAADCQGDAGNLNSAVTITVNVQDSNDNSPLFTQPVYTANVNENYAGNTAIGGLTILANDADSGVNGALTYSITGGDGSASFSINPATAVLSTIAVPNLDHETKLVHTLFVEATDGGTPSLSGSTVVQIFVDDVNDNAPVFLPAIVQASVEENGAAIVDVTILTIRDLDNTAINMQQNLIITSNPSSIFQLVYTPSAVQTTYATLRTTVTLDREISASYIVIVEARDTGTPSLTGTSTISVSVNDVNDNNPVIINTPYVASVYENSTAGTIILDVDAVDGDYGVNKILTYTITSGNAANLFTIDPGTGILSLKSFLDRETVDIHSLIVVVKDGGSPSRSTTTTLTITVLDNNDNAPIIPTTYTFYIAENVPLDTRVGQITGTDADYNENAALQYQIVSTTVGSPDRFKIDEPTGVIFTKSNALNREGLDIYQLLCRVSDGGSPSQYSDTVVKIILTDENDNKPVFSTSLHSVSIKEHEPAGSYLLTVGATDYDLSINAKIIYYIDPINNQSNQLFKIDVLTGNITTRKEIDREKDGDQFSFKVYAKDSGTSPLSNWVWVTIYIIDINDHTPLFSKINYTTEVAYNENSHYEVLKLTVIDLDKGYNSKLVFTQSGYESDFKIDADLGNISMVAGRTFPTFTKYIFTVYVGDYGVPSKRSSTSIRIDTFDPNLVVIKFELNLEEDDYLNVREKFINELTLSCRTKYDFCNVHHWKYSKRRAQNVLLSNRRRLLQVTSVMNVDFDYVNEYVYATVDDHVSFEDTRKFLTKDELLILFRRDAETSNPSTLIQGANYDSFKVYKVEPYIEAEETKAWYKTTIGIIVITCSAVGLIVLITLLMILIYCCCLRERQEEKVRNQRLTANETSHRQKPAKTNMFINKTVKPTTATVLIASDESNLKKSPPPNETKLAKRPSSRPTSRSMTPVLDPQKQYDKTAVDPITGKMYEYNSQSNERRWLHDRDGNAISNNNWDN